MALGNSPDLERARELRRYLPLRLVERPALASRCRHRSLVAQPAAYNRRRRGRQAPEPDAGEGRIQLLDQPLRDDGEDHLQVQTRDHLERDALQDLPTILRR